MFKLLALQVFAGCDGNIKKCLKEDVLYYFCTDYRLDVPGKIYKGSKYAKPLSEKFFSIPIVDEWQEHDEPSPTININAIVGKNGDGKSTIVEIVMRLVNNYIVLHPQGVKNPEARELLEVKGVYAELYFQVDNCIYKLIRSRKEHGVFRIANITEGFSFDKIHEAAPEVFATIYTFVSNYSHYAYNVYDFRSEWVDRDKNPENPDSDNERCWLYHIFHKNDGYATPISLHPYRKSGNMDVNNEYRLSRQRLLYLFINSNDSDNSFRNILDTPAESVRFELSKRSKFHEMTLIEHFRKYERIDTSLDWATKAIDKYFPKLEKHMEVLDADLESLESEYFLDIANLFEDITADGDASNSDKKKYRAYFKAALQWLQTHYLTKHEHLRDSHEKSNIETYWKQVYNLSKMAKKRQSSINVTQLNRTTYYSCHRYNIRQLARLRTIYDIAMENNIDPMVCFDDYESLSPADRCKLYIIYKVISIYETYPKYRAVYDEAIRVYLAGSEECYEFLPDEYKKLRKQLEEDKKLHSHITRKLEQAENYIAEYEKNGHKDVYRSIITQQKPPVNASYSVPLGNLRAYYNSRGLRLENLPPAIYDIEIRFKADKIFGMSTLSSGEKQLLNTIGAIIYHLQNIDSATTMRYQSVNLILEEIELYFHPDYQRQFIQTLIRQIHGASLQNIKNINITFVTHSPFILSDIPKCNVLFLKDGAPDYDMQENTFGANIHSLLKNGFFLPNLPMGQFAHLKINRLFRILNDVNYPMSEEEIAKMKQEISVIGEPYLREQLFRLLRIR